ncbi:trans-sialidase [Trypanosoma conorhini]|uniref:Trans-sialidase n=1 Tax=Trypanosoma conorhini TaxID=83891 RepID=A0A3R7KMN6_9TRYP|nr:trans-sialidase [Trypanosoma conorhini]RNE97582.1 trans-sialidase [Trypanosoma conorhini]
MPRRLFSSAALPLLLLVLSCEAAAANVSEARPMGLFNQGKTEASGGGGDTEASGGSEVTTFNGHSLFAVSGFMVALAKANYGTASGPNSGVWEKHVSAVGGGWAQRTMTVRDATDWWTGIAVQRGGEAGRRFQLGGPKAVVKADRIFMLLERLRGTSKNRATFVLQLVFGEVGEGKRGGKRITWGAGKSLEEIVNSQLTTRSWGQF